ncbi:MAG: outer membrane lipoprotein-sorting protein [Terracidiphilus sp.]
MKRSAQWVLVAALVPSIHASTADLHEILSASRDRIQTADYRITGRLVRVEANGTRTSENVTVKAHWFPGVLRVLVDVNAPAKAREHVLLEMRPDGEDTIFIAHPGDHAPVPLPFARWDDGPLGGTFSYEDFLEPQYFWPVQIELAPARRGARDCSVVKSAPGPIDRTHYAEEKTWLDKTIGFPVYAEKTRKGSGVIKQFTYYGLRHDGGIWSASQVEAKVAGKDGSTLFIIDRGSAKANLGAKDFSPESMIHFQGGL